MGVSLSYVPGVHSFKAHKPPRGRYLLCFTDDHLSQTPDCTSVIDWLILLSGQGDFLRNLPLESSHRSHLHPSNHHEVVVRGWGETGRPLKSCVILGTLHGHSEPQVPQL